MNYTSYRDTLLKNIKALHHPSGAFSAALGEHYVEYTWWRDNFYINLPFLKHDPELYKSNYHKYLDVLKGYERDYSKFSSLIKYPVIKPGEEWRLLQPRVYAHDFSENHSEPWGWVQFDSWGYILIGIYLGEEQGLHIIRDESDREIVQMFIDSMIAIDIVNTKDSSQWEERIAHNSTSLGICIKGFEYMQQLGFNIPHTYLNYARDTLEDRLPHEAADRGVDMGLLFLPYLNITDEITSKYIIQKVEIKLLRKYGVIRYIDDAYYNDGNGEMQWSMGLLYLGLDYYKLGYIETARYYLDRCMDLYSDGHIAEGKFTDGRNNPNVDLGWSMALAVLLLDKFID